MVYEHIHSSDESSEDNTEEEPKKKKKKKQDAGLLGALVAKKDVPADITSDDKSKADKKKLAEKPPAGEQADKTAKDAAETADSDAVESLDNETELTADEQVQVLDEYIDERLMDLQAEVLPTETPDAAAQQAIVAFLVRLKQRLAALRAGQRLEYNVAEIISEASDEAVEDSSVVDATGESDEPEEAELSGAGDQPDKAELAAVMDDPVELPPEEPVSIFAAAAAGGVPRATQTPATTSTIRTSEETPLSTTTPASQESPATLTDRNRGNLFTRGSHRRHESTSNSDSKKVEKQVAALKSQVRKQEARIRAKAHERVRPSAATVALPERPAQDFNRPPATAVAETLPYAFAAAARTESPPPTPDNRIAYRPAQSPAEMRRQTIAESPASPEPTGVATPERTVATAPIPAVREHAPQRRTSEHMNRDELLAYASTIRLGETNLRRVYDAQLVNESGLRRLVRAHESGQDLRRALAREFLARELRFERDPRLHGGAQDAQQGGGGATATDTSDTRQLTDTKQQTATQSQKSQTTDAKSLGKQPSGQQTNVSPQLIIGLVVITILLAIYAIWLTLTR